MPRKRKNLPERKVRILINFTPDQLLMLDLLSDRTYKTRNRLVREAINEYLEPKFPHFFTDSDPLT